MIELRRHHRQRVMLGTGRRVTASHIQEMPQFRGARVKA